MVHTTTSTAPIRKQPFWLKEELQREQDEVNALTKWFQSDRFQGLTRPYSAHDVAALRGTCGAEPDTAPVMPCRTDKKLFNLLKSLSDIHGYTHTFGALDPVQVVQMAKYVKSIYVSGWQCSSTASTSNECGPDLADYPYDTVPNKVDQLVRAQVFHDRKQKEARMRMSLEQRAMQPPVDYFTPIIADGDTGHGGITAVMKLMKLFIEAGAAGVHIEDQRPSSKKCGHLAGKVLVSVQEHIDRLVAARLQADIMGAETILVARTDAEAATLLDSNADARDHAFILGSTNPSIKSLHDYIHEHMSSSTTITAPTNLETIVAQWTKDAQLMTFEEAVQALIVKHTKRDEIAAQWRSLTTTKIMSIPEKRLLAKQLLNQEVTWDWDKPRTKEGFYQIRGGVDMCIARGIAFAPYSDLLWMETAKPCIKDATKFSQGVRNKYPGKWLAYNLSPSFNWDNANMTDDDIQRFTDEIAKLGFVWQFITLAGFHANALVIDTFAKQFANEGKMLAYVKCVQRKEREAKVETLMHQKWSGIELIDKAMTAVMGGMSSTTANGASCTEKQFKV